MFAGSTFAQDTFAAQQSAAAASAPAATALTGYGRAPYSWPPGITIAGAPAPAPAPAQMPSTLVGAMYGDETYAWAAYAWDTSEIPVAPAPAPAPGPVLSPAYTLGGDASLLIPLDRGEPGEDPTPTRAASDWYRLMTLVTPQPGLA